MMVSNRNLLFQVSIFGCHVSFRECIVPSKYVNPQNFKGWPLAESKNLSGCHEGEWLSWLSLRVQRGPKSSKTAWEKHGETVGNSRVKKRPKEKAVVKGYNLELPPTQ